MKKIEQLKTKLSSFEKDLKPYNDIIKYISTLVSDLNNRIEITKQEIDIATNKELDKALYKWVTRSGKAAHAGNQFQYSLPSNGKPGKWHTVRGKVERCSHGFHYIKRKDIRSWTAGRLFVVEVRGAHSYDLSDNKGVARSLRLVREISKSSNEYKKLMGYK